MVTAVILDPRSPIVFCKGLVVVVAVAVAVAVAAVVLGFVSNNCIGKFFFEIIPIIPLKLPPRPVRALLESRGFTNPYSPSRLKKGMALVCWPKSFLNFRLN